KLLSVPALQAPRHSLLPYTTLFRSHSQRAGGDRLALSQDAVRISRGRAHRRRGTLRRHSELGAARRGTQRCASLNTNPPMNLETDRKRTRLNSSHQVISYAVFSVQQ